MIACQKDNFSIPDHITYLNCSYMSPLPKPVEEAGVRGLLQKKHPWEVMPGHFFSQVEEVKNLFARSINAGDPQSIVIIPSVSYGIASAVKNVHPRPGQNIVMLEEQFPSNVYAWQRLAQESGCELRIVQAPDTLSNRGEAWNNDLLESIDNSTAAVAIPNAHWADGTLYDLRAVRAKTNQVGALLIIDGTQSVGAYPFDVSEIQPDALVCCGYKWLLGPYSFGLAYYSERFANGIPIEENWMNRLDSENFQNLVKYQPLYKPGANRFSVGENSHFIAVPMVAEALKLLHDWQPANIQEYCGQISEKFLSSIKEKGCWVEEPRFRGNHLLGVRFPKNIDIEVVKAKATAQNIFVSFRGNAMRVAPHLYNTERDFEKLDAIIG